MSPLFQPLSAWETPIFTQGSGQDVSFSLLGGGPSAGLDQGLTLPTSATSDASAPHRLVSRAGRVEAGCLQGLRLPGFTSRPHLPSAAGPRPSNSTCLSLLAGKGRQQHLLHRAVPHSPHLENVLLIYKIVPEHSFLWEGQPHPRVWAAAAAPACPAQPTTSAHPPGSQPGSVLWPSAGASSQLPD